MNRPPASCPAISVVITTHNRATLVAHAVESVLAQTQPAAEIVVIDDGSTDDTAAVLRRYDGRIRVIRQPNAGMSAARNAGIRATRHEWVTFLDDDDEYAPARLAGASEALRQFPEASVQACNARMIFAGGAELNLFQLRGLAANAPRLLGRPLEFAVTGCFFVQSMVIRRDLLFEVGLFRDALPAHDDLEFLFRLTRCTPWCIDPAPLLHLIRRSDAGANLSGAWRAHAFDRAQALVSVYRETLERPDLTPGEIRLLQNALATYLFESGASLLEKGEPRSARVCFGEAFTRFTRLRSRLKAAGAFALGRTALRTFDKFAPHRPAVVR